jgi:hypothetical protein
MAETIIGRNWTEKSMQNASMPLLAKLDFKKANDSGGVDDSQTGANDSTTFIFEITLGNDTESV